MSVSINSSNQVKHGAAVALLRAYLADFLASTPTMKANHGLIGLLDQALQAVRTLDLRQAADALDQASKLAAKPVQAPQEQLIWVIQQERSRISLAVAVASALLLVTTRFSQEGGSA